MARSFPLLSALRLPTAVHLAASNPLKSVNKFFYFSRYFFLAILFFLSGNLAHAASSSAIDVRAELSRNRVPAGDMVQLDVKITGTDHADLPPDISIDGLQIRLAGQSSQVQVINFSVSSSILYSYIVIPLRSGTFTIPPIQVRANGKYFNTSPLQLTVIGSAGASSQATSQSPSGSTTTFSAPVKQRFSSRSSNSQIYFAELAIPKKKLYVGEVVPAEARFYIDAHYQAKPLSGLHFGGEGLLAERFNEPEVSSTQRDGLLYNVITFRTLISAVKPGSLELAPATLDALIEVPGAAPAGMDPDLFFQLFGNQGASSQRQKVTLKSNSVSLEILPLPKEGQPADFSGAIGDFHLTASVAPNKATTGDPVTLSLKLEGKGNFKATKAPELTQTQTWRTYPPSDHFESSDALGWRGLKTFEMTMMAQQPLTTTPGASFCYFDPTTAKYITLTTNPLPISMTVSTSSTNNSVSSIPAASASATPSAPTKNEQHPSSLPGSSQHYWKDPFHRLNFVIAWLALLTASLFFALYLGIKRYQSNGGSPHKRHRLKLQALWSRLQDNELDPLSFYTTAVAYGEGIMSDAFFKTKMTAADQASIAHELQPMITRRNELHYGARELVLRDIEKKKILQTLAQWHQLLEKRK